MIRNEGMAPSTVQMHTDSDRFYICERDPTGLEGPERVVIPNDTRSRTWLWDGKYYYFYGQQTGQYAQEYAEKYISKENREKFIRMVTGNVTIYVDVTFKRFDGTWFVAQQDFQFLVCFWDMEQRSSRNCVLALRDRSVELARRGVFVVLVHDATIAQAALSAWISKSGISFASVWIAYDAAGIRRNWRVKSLPWLILTDREHVVVAEGFALDEIDEKIEPIDKKH